MRPLLPIACVVATSLARICAAQPVADVATARADFIKSVSAALSVEWHPANVFGAHLHNPYLGPWVVRLRVTVKSTGELGDIAVDSSSGLTPFDDEAVRTFRAIRPFPVPPAALVDPATSTFTFTYSFVTPGWSPPQYSGDALLRTPETASWEVGSSFDLQRRTNALSGSTSIPGDATYQRMSVTATASKYVRRVGLFEFQIPVETIRYREPSSSSSADLTGFGDALVHLHRFSRYHAWFGSYFIGAEVPTGKTEAMALVGQTLPAIVQLGTGTFDPDIGACIARRVNGTTSISFCDHTRGVLYSNSKGYRDPWTLDARLVVSKSLFCRQTSAQAGLFYEKRGIAHWSGVASPVDGHDELFAEASAWVVLYRGLAVRSTVELPLYERVDGMQVADTIRVMGSVSYDFDRL
jgi:TonB family protein